MPSLAPLPEHLSNLALMVALEDMGCLTEARRLQLQLFRTEGKDAIETLIRESQKHKKEGGISNIKFIPKNLGGSSGGIKRAQRSVALPEACTSEYGWVFYETALVMIEFVDKLPPTDLIREFKASAVNVTQQCTSESWDHLLEVGQTLTESPELDKATISVEDQIHFVIRITDILKRILVAFVQKYFEIYFG